MFDAILELTAAAGVLATNWCAAVQLGVTPAPEMVEQTGAFLHLAEGRLANLHESEDILIRAIHYVPARRLDRSLQALRELVNSSKG